VGGEVEAAYCNDRVVDGDIFQEKRALKAIERRHE
jgi:hypothetical protein